MDQQQFRIPKQNDRQLILALGAIRNDIRESANLVIRVNQHYGGTDIEVQDQEPENSAAISYILSENSEVMPRLHLFEQGSNRTALTIDRKTVEITDLVTVHWQDWGQNIPMPQRPKVYVKLMALARKHLRAFDVDANLSGLADKEWGRYRDSQQTILNSLQETQKSIAVDFSRQVLEAQKIAKAKYDKLEEDLRATQKTVEARLESEHEAKLKSLDERESLLKKREDSFNTKEARYVARQVQQEQIDDIKKWLEGWNLTKGTTRKRWPVVFAYGLGAILTGFLVIWFSAQNVDVLRGKDFALVAWWQWILLSLKAVAPLAAFITFIVYFIRWTASWARQHSEEEFRNRARILDIGRARWLLEAVRDAQDKNKDLPPELLKELSRNLFSFAGPSEGSEIHPQAVSDLLMQGLSSIRVKSPDGAEVEASRTNKSK